MRLLPLFPFGKPKLLLLIAGVDDAPESVRVCIVVKPRGVDTTDAPLLLVLGSLLSPILALFPPFRSPTTVESVSESFEEFSPSSRDDVVGVILLEEGPTANADDAARNADCRRATADDTCVNGGTGCVADLRFDEMYMGSLDW